MTTWEYASSKIGKVSAKCLAIAKEVFNAAQSAGHDVWFIWGDGSEPDHVFNRQGRPVLDFMVRNRAAGDWVRNYIWAHRERLGLKHVIWAQHITSTVVSPGVKRKMKDRGNPTANHDDHNHAEWFAGAYVPLTKPAPTSKGEGMFNVIRVRESDGSDAWYGAIIGRPLVGIANGSQLADWRALKDASGGREFEVPEHLLEFARTMIGGE